MKLRRLILKGLLHHRRTHLAALATAALVSAVMIGALGVGDSVRESLAIVADARLGRIRFAAHARDCLWRTDLAGSLARELDTTVSSTLLLGGTVALPNGSARVANAQVLGVDDAFWALSPGGHPPAGSWPAGGCAVSERLAKRLGLVVGTSIVVRVEVPAMVPRDAPIGTGSDAAVTLLLEVAAVLDADAFGTFSLRIGQVPPPNVILPRLELQRAARCLGFANTLLLGDADEARVAPAVADCFGIEDTGLLVGPVAGSEAWQLTSSRVFLEPAAEQAGLGLPGSFGILTWLVNDISTGTRHTPYSMVAALPRGHAPIPDDLADDEILVNTWLAEDLAVADGDTIALTYYVVGDGRKLTERTTEFRIRGVLPIEGAAADRKLMPDFPGLTGAKDCRDWDPGFALDLSRIRDKDEEYWDEHEGTPKAFIALTAGRKLWGNRFGSLTAVRLQSVPDRDALEAAIRARLDPGAFGLTFVDLAKANELARAGGMDFGGLFLGFSFLLLAAALLLMGLVVALNMVMRQEEIATLLALGFDGKRIRRLFAVEHGIVALVGGMVGVPLGYGLTAAALTALDTVWSDLAGSLRMSLVIDAGTATMGALCGASISFAVSWLVLRRIVSGSVRDAFTKSEERAARDERTRPRRGVRVWVGPALVLGAMALAASSGTGRDPATAGAFFGSGMLLLTGFLFILATVPLRTGVRGRLSARTLALRNLTRRRGRSMAVIGILAFGVFMFLGVTVFRRDRLTGPGDRTGGTGGFALVGECTVAIVHDLNSPEGRKFFALTEEDLAGVRVVRLRVRTGDDATCRSLTRAQTPELVAVDPAELEGRFTFVKGASDWTVLAGSEDDEAVPAVIDQATFWTLGKGLGDEFTMTGEEGRPFEVRIAGVIDNAILHGQLIISESEYLRRFPSEGGYRRFLVDAPESRREKVAALLTRQLTDRGIALEKSEARLNAFNAVENTYLGIFQALGGIGLLLGSAGLALVVSRNVLQRRAELALLGAVGFTRGRIVRLVNAENAILLGLGLLAGLAASAVSLIPAILTPGAEFATPGMGLVLFGLGAGGSIFTWVATRATLSGNLLDNLREE